MTGRGMTGGGIGARVLRKEDARFLRGRGQYVGDLALPGMLDAAFVRSPFAHARILSVSKPEEGPDEGFVFDAADLADVPPIRAENTIPTYRPTEQPILAGERALFAGQTVAICVAPTRAEAEDLAESVLVDWEELTPVVDARDALAADAPRLHPEWPDNLMAATGQDGDIEAIAARAPVRVTRRYAMMRQAMVPMEGRGVVAHWDSRNDQLVVHITHQCPHVFRTGVAHHLGLAERQVRVISPDVGGGFGYKAPLYPEELAVCWAARRLERPVRWLEDRYEHLTAGASARENAYEVTAHADERGRILALDAEMIVNIGAYSFWPHTGVFEAIQATGILPGPYRIGAYRMRTQTVVTNKPPQTPYRAVARPSACFAIELTIDAVARAVGREPHEVRLENLVRAGDMPYSAVTGKIYDSGDYPDSLARALGMIDLDALRAEQRAGRADGRLLGVGLAMYTEHTGISTSTFAPLGIALMPGYEQAMVRMTPDGELEVAMGVHSHGQGMETTMAQVASEVLGLDPARVRLIHGDTGLTPYSTGTYASRAMIMNGGAVAVACEKLGERLRPLGAHLMQCAVEETTIRDGRVHGPGGASVGFAEIAALWYKQPQEMPPGVDPGGLEVSAGYRPEDDRGAFSFSTHVAVVAVDPEMGTVEILDYAVVDDCGTRVNPMIVDGQVLGGTAQGIGSGLYEESRFDAGGQPLSVTFADYLVPGTTEVPRIRLQATETPSPKTWAGIKGVGEGAAIAPPAALVNAINDALRPLGAEVAEAPASPDRILDAIAAARAPAAAAGDAT